jgi:hypothetical protein
VGRFRLGGNGCCWSGRGLRRLQWRTGRR